VDKERKESKNWKKGDRVLLSTKDLVFKEQPVSGLQKVDLVSFHFFFFFYFLPYLFLHVGLELEAA